MPNFVCVCLLLLSAATAEPILLQTIITSIPWISATLESKSHAGFFVKFVKINAGNSFINWSVAGIDLPLWSENAPLRRGGYQKNKLNLPQIGISGKQFPYIISPDFWSGKLPSTTIVHTSFSLFRMIIRSPESRPPLGDASDRPGPPYGVDV